MKKPVLNHELDLLIFITNNSFNIYMSLYHLFFSFRQRGGLPLYTFLIMLYIVLTTYTADMYVILYALLILGALCEIQIFAQILHRNKQINK